MIITALTNDPKYKEQLKVLLTSLKKTNPHIMVYVACLGFLDETLESYHPRCHVHQHSLKNRNAGTIVMQGVRIARKILRNTMFDWVLWLDCDCIVRGDLEPLISKQRAGIWCAHRPKEKIEMRYQCGVWFVRKGAGVMGLLKDWFDIGSLLKSWWGEQQGLAMCESALVKDLDTKYNDLTFRDDSVVWHARTMNLMKEPFRGEYSQLLMEANQC